MLHWIFNNKKRVNWNQDFSVSFGIKEQVKNKHADTWICGLTGLELELSFVGRSLLLTCNGNSQNAIFVALFI